MNILDRALASIDAANREDPNTIFVDGADQPTELVYAWRMTAMLNRFVPEASDALKLAVRAQHLKRWHVPRSSFPMDRAGYHRWRNDLKRKHATWAGEILAETGYDDAFIARVQSLIRKENLKVDSDAQTLEDIACLVFLEHYAADFSDKHEPAKFKAILLKTWAKMSPTGQATALTLSLPDRLSQVIKAALAEGTPT